MSRHFICSIHVTIGETGVRGGGPTEPMSDLIYLRTHMGHAPQFLIEVLSCRPLLLHFSHTQENQPRRLQDNCLPAASTPCPRRPPSLCDPLTPPAAPVWDSSGLTKRTRKIPCLPFPPDFREPASEQQSSSSKAAAAEKGGGLLAPRR